MAVNTDQLVREVIHLAPIIKQQFVRPVDACFAGKIPPNQMSILNILAKQGSRTMVQLSKQILVCRQQMTQLVDEMEKKGLISRALNESDRRSVLIILTDHGRKRLEEINIELVEELRNVFEAYTDEQKASLMANAREIRRIINE